MVAATDLTFAKEVLNADGLVLVDFWAAWCMPCRLLSPIVDKVAQAYPGQLKVVKVNVDENPRLSQDYGIMAIPTMMLFQNGKMVQRIAGLLPEAQLKRLVDQYLAA